MAGLRSLVLLLVAVCSFFTLINSAAVHNLIFDNESENVNDNYNYDRESESHLVFPESYRTRRAICPECKICVSTTPCGWAVYTPFTRRVDYFMKNTCDCPETFKCVRTDDDLSVSAYVYRCRANVTEADIESPDSKDSN